MRSRSRGFTLIEMTMVILTVGILCAIAAPRYSASLNRYGAESAAQRIVADIGLAQSTARTASRNQIISFNVLANTYQMSNVRASDSAAMTYVVELSRAPYQARLISASFGNAAQVSFDRYGAPSSAGAVVVQVGDVQKTIVLDVNTGKAGIQ